jgi:hypothetical protein
MGGLEGWSMTVGWFSSKVSWMVVSASDHF